MDFIAGAKILADRIGDTVPVPREQVSDDARPLFQWCGVEPGPSLEHPEPPEGDKHA